MGNKRLYDIMKEKDAIYMKEEFTDEDGIKAAELEGEFATMKGKSSSRPGIIRKPGYPAPR